MEWVLDHLKLVLGALVLAFYLMKAIKRQSTAESDGEGSLVRDANSDPQEAERTRRIQEEIRRRILARQRGESPVEDRGSVIVFDPEPSPTVEVEPPRPPPIPAGQRPTASVAKRPGAWDTRSEILERQRALQERYQSLVRGKSPQSIRQSMSMPSTSRARPVRGGGGSRTVQDLRRQLSSPQSLRRAVLLREILGQPLGMHAGMPELPRR